MGGLGSGRWDGHRKSQTVEDCLALDVAKLARDGMVRPVWQGTLHWRYVATVKAVSSATYFTGPDEPDGLLFVLHYRFTESGEEVNLPIRLQTTRPHLGGVRWYFI